MLIRFSVENFLSFKERQVFSLLPGKGTLKSQHKSAPIKGISVLKTSVIYGANASGKSNLIRAIDFGGKLVSVGTQSGQSIAFTNFKLDNGLLHENSRIEYSIQHKGKNYAYGFVLNSTMIVEEWLYEIRKNSEVMIFERKESNKFDLRGLFKLNKKLEQQQFIEFTAKATPENQLFLNEIKNRNISQNVDNIFDLTNVIDWFQDVLTVIYPTSKSVDKIFQLLNNNDVQNIFEQMLRYFDTGIDGIIFIDIDIEKIRVPDEILKKIHLQLKNDKSDKSIFLSNLQDDQYYIFSKGIDGIIKAQLLKTAHKVNGSPKTYFDLKEESDGTRRILDLIPLIIDFFKGGKVIIIDEMERSLHPNLIYDLFDFFLDKCEKVHSQFIVASHESRLLTQKLLRKDEIWFVVKDKTGASKLHSLEEYKIRFDKEVEKDYLLGRYNGIPRLGNREDLTIISF